MSIPPSVLAALMGSLDRPVPLSPKACAAHNMIRNKPEAWFKDSPIDDRDRALINAGPAPFVSYGQRSYLRKMYHLKQGEEEFGSSDWSVEEDKACKKMVSHAGGQLVGFNDIDVSNPVQWKSMKINVNIEGTPNAGFNWGFLATMPSKTRIFRGPPESCRIHPWDAMILRDCYASTDGIMSVSSIASRYWDILVMKMCEDYDYPWVVIAVNDAGPYNPAFHCECYKC
ncbi:hypothetical protein MGN70_003298 [Eutypa lata]|nr:hypothetical protein MGN70_003298 [Eutypa lata]